MSALASAPSTRPDASSRGTISVPTGRASPTAAATASSTGTTFRNRAISGSSRVWQPRIFTPWASQYSPISRFGMPYFADIASAWGHWISFSMPISSNALRIVASSMRSYRRATEIGFFTGTRPEQSSVEKPTIVAMRIAGVNSIQDPAGVRIRSWCEALIDEPPAGRRLGVSRGRRAADPRRTGRPGPRCGPRGLPLAPYLRQAGAAADGPRDRQRRRGRARRRARPGRALPARVHAGRAPPPRRARARRLPRQTTSGPTTARPTSRRRPASSRSGPVPTSGRTRPRARPWPGPC